MKNLIKFLCYIYFEIHNDTTGLVLYSSGYDYGFKIKKEQI